MAELQQQERLQPALLDRLTDDSPQVRKTSSFSSVSEKPANDSADSPVAEFSNPVHQSASLVISQRKLRECVKRDLSWLFNTVNLGSIEDLTDYPLVAESVLNYGMPDLTGSNVENINIRELERKLHDIIVQFEPRILSKSLIVKVIKGNEMSRNAIQFDIECDIWGQPAPEHIHLDTELELGTGKFKFSDPSLG